MGAPGSARGGREPSPHGLKALASERRRTAATQGTQALHASSAAPARPTPARPAPAPAALRAAADSLKPAGAAQGPPRRPRAAASPPSPVAPVTRPSPPPALPKGLLQWLLALFASDDPEKQKQRVLREIAGYLKKSRPRYYNPSLRLAEPALAKFFYEIYKAVASAQILLKGAGTSVALRTALIETTLGPGEAALRERLTEEAISERARKGADPAALAVEVSRDLRSLQERLDAPAAREIDAVYNRLLVLLDLVGFDYYILLHRFDAALPERDFMHKPHFVQVSAESVRENLEDFLEILPAVDPDADWDRILAVLKVHRGVEVIAAESLRRALQLIREAQRTGVLLMIARHMENDPAWKPMVRSRRERIVFPYLEKLRTQAEAAARTAVQGKQDEKIAVLAREVFGSAALTRLAHYSPQANTAFTQKMLGGYTHVSSLNYLRAFFIDYLGKSLRDVVDILIIKGQWIKTGLSQQMSEAFHQLLKVDEAVTALDAGLAPDGETGRRLRTIAIRVERDRKALADMRALLQRINDQAQGLVGSGVTQLVALAKVLKLAHEDIASPSPELIANWRELRAAEKDLRGLIAGMYRKIYSFVQLMQMSR